MVIVGNKVVSHGDSAAVFIIIGSSRKLLLIQSSVEI